MNIEYSNGNSYCGGISLALFFGGDPGVFKRSSDMEQMLKYRPKHDPGKFPRRERRDKYTTIGAMAGMIIGGTAAAIVGYQQFGIFGGILCCIGGIIVGGMIGATIGSVIKKWMAKRGKKGQDGENSDFP